MSLLETLLYRVGSYVRYAVSLLIGPLLVSSVRKEVSMYVIKGSCFSKQR